MKAALVAALLVLALLPDNALAQTGGNTTGGISIGSGNTVTIGVPPSGSTTSGATGAGSTPATICGTVTALTATSITLLAVPGAAGSVTLTIPPTVPVPTPLIATSTVCVLALGGAVTRFLGPCPDVSTGPTGGTTTTIGNLTVSGPIQIPGSGNITSGGVAVDLTGAAIAGTPVMVRGNVCSQVQVNANNQVVVVMISPAGSGPDSPCPNGCVLVSSAAGAPGPLTPTPIETPAVDAATVVHRIGLMVAF